MSLPFLNSSILITQYYSFDGEIEIGFTPDSVDSAFYLAEGRCNRNPWEEQIERGCLFFENSSRWLNYYGGGKSLFRLDTGVELVDGVDSIEAGKPYKIVVGINHKFIRHFGNRFEEHDEKFVGKLHYIKVKGSNFGYVLNGDNHVGVELPSLQYQFDHANTEETLDGYLVVKNLDKSVPEQELLGHSVDTGVYDSDTDTYSISRDAGEYSTIHLFTGDEGANGQKGYERVIRVEFDLELNDNSFCELWYNHPGPTKKTIFNIHTGKNVHYFYEASSGTTIDKDRPRLVLGSTSGTSTAKVRNLKVYESHDCLLPPSSKWVTK